MVISNNYIFDYVNHIIKLVFGDMNNVIWCVWIWNLTFLILNLPFDLLNMLRFKITIN